jgi:hypothetical protein
LSLFFQSFTDEGKAAVGVEWGWRFGCGGPTCPLDGIIEELDHLFNVFRSFK